MNLTLSERERMAWIAGNHELADALGALVDIEHGYRQWTESLLDTVPGPNWIHEMFDSVSEDTGFGDIEDEIVNQCDKMEAAIWDLRGTLEAALP